MGLGLLTVFALPMVLCMAILRFTGEGCVFYFQDRVGQDHKLFKVYKFVTMAVGSETTGTTDITIRNDPRVLPVGRVLRITKLNELPQIFNVLKGDMSIVGWRPLMPRGFSDYPEYVKERIVKCKPGLTGIGSIVFRDEEAIVTEAGKRGKDLVAVYREDILPYKGEIELWYNERQTLVSDIKIILLTAVSILFPNNQQVFKWFKGMPIPESSILREHLGLD